MKLVPLPTETTSLVSAYNWIGDSSFTYASPYGELSSEMKKDNGVISAKSYFKFIKGKFSVLEKMKMERRMEKLQKAFDRAINNGQDAFAEKFMDRYAQEYRESLMAVKGIKMFVEKADVEKFRHKVRKGKISNTNFEKYTRVIPQKVLDKKKKVEDIFDSFVIYHYWSDEAEDVKKMSSSEKANMKDPILFGRINESDRLYFIADWIDEFCDLTFDELIDAIPDREDEDFIIKQPSLDNI